MWSIVINMKLLFDKQSKRIILADRKNYSRLPDLKQIENKNKLSPIWKTKKRNSIKFKTNGFDLIKKIDLNPNLKIKRVNDNMFVIYFNKDSIGLLIRKDETIIFGRIPVYVLKGIIKLLLEKI